MSQDDAPEDADAADASKDADENEQAAVLTDVHLVGPATAEVLDETDVEATDFREKSVAYETLVELGVNPGVAARLRKEHSLHWSFGGSDEGDDSLEERSEKMGGLQDDEREWVAASSGDWESNEPDTDDATSDGDWSPSGESSATVESESSVSVETATDGSETAEAATDGSNTVEATTDGSGGAEAAEAAWRERSRPDPVTDVPGVDEETAEILANGGITSVRSLATAHPEHVADSLGLDGERVAELRDAARDLA